MHRIYFSLVFSLVIPIAFQGQISVNQDLQNYSYSILRDNGSGWSHQGTGFFIKYRDSFFLVTNYHVLTNRSSTGDRPLDSSNRFTMPSKIFVMRKSTDNTAKGNIIPLYDSKKKKNYFSTCN